MPSRAPLSHSQSSFTCRLAHKPKWPSKAKTISPFTQMKYEWTYMYLYKRKNLHFSPSYPNAYMPVQRFLFLLSINKKKVHPPSGIVLSQGESGNANSLQLSACHWALKNSTEAKTLGMSSIRGQI